MARVYLGKEGNKKFFYELNSLTRHAAILGTTGSGKTVMGKAIIEEALARGIPVVAIDPKGDLGGLAVSSKKLDFRPFSGSMENSKKIASLYQHHIQLQEINVSNVDNLSKIKTRIYTPKSDVGKQVSLMPDLKALHNFAKIKNTNPAIVADLLEPISESIVQLAGITGTKNEKAKSLISCILDFNWSEGRDVSFASLVKEIIMPPFETIGSLAIDDFMKDNERKAVAALVSLLLSSPAKSAWMHGDKIRMEEILKTGNLSIFDLRFTGNNDDKQFVTEQILSQLYLYLIKKGGSDNLKYILYIDELAGLFPMPPSNPPCKKLLELLIRQARAFGLGIVLATQSPGDIDYRIFGNVGTRLIGKLRTEIEIEKVAIAMNLPPSQLRQQAGSLSTGDFIYNDAVKNENRRIHARWLLTYHAGPLKPEQIRWINNPDSLPKVEGNLKIDKSKKKTKEKAPRSAKTIVREALRKKSLPTSKSRKKKVHSSFIDHSLVGLVKRIKRQADKCQIKISMQEADIYLPHLRIVIEPKKKYLVDMPLQGPYVFDLTSRIIPIGNYLKNMHFRSFMHSDVTIIKPKASIEKSIQYAVRDAMTNLTKRFYYSKLTELEDFERSKIEKANYEHLMEQARSRIHILKLRKEKDSLPLLEKLKVASRKKSLYQRKIRSDKAKRILKRLFLARDLLVSTRKHKEYKNKIQELHSTIQQLKKRINLIRRRFNNERKMIENKAFVSSHMLVGEEMMHYYRKDLEVHAMLLLVPQRKSER